MKKSVSLSVRKSEVTEKLNGLLAKDELTAEEDAELRSLTEEAQNIEPRLRAALVAENDDDLKAEIRFQNGEGGENVELRSMIEKANLGLFVEAAIKQRSLSGVEAELQQHRNLAANEFPVELLETRAVTPVAKTVGVGAQQSEIVMPIFASGDAAFLGVAMPIIEAGDSVYPVLATRPTIKGPYGADSTSVDETDGTISSSVLDPQRTQAAWIYRRTDAVRLQGLDEVLRSVLSMGLTENLDALFHAQVDSDITDTNTTAQLDFGSYRKNLVYDRIDGRYANMASDIRLLMGTATYAHASTKYQSNGDMSALDSMEQVTGGVRVSPHVADIASKKQPVIVRRGMRPTDAVMPIWRNVQIVTDEVTRAKTGEIVVTAFLQANMKIVRADGFQRVLAQVTA